MLPRSSTNWRSGRTAVNWARRRTDPVATVAPSAKSARVAPTSTSRGVAPFAEGGDHQPLGGDRRQVLGECTARSASPSSTARCTSLTNTPCPPIVCSGTSACCVRSPIVSTNTSSTCASRVRSHQRLGHCARPGFSPARCLVWRGAAAGRRASRSAEIEQVADGRRVAFALWRAGVVLEPHRRRCATAWRRCPW